MSGAGENGMGGGGPGVCRPFGGGGVGRAGRAAPREKRRTEMRNNDSGGGEGSLSGATLFREVQEKNGSTNVVAKRSECHGSFTGDRHIPEHSVEMVA